MIGFGLGFSSVFAMPVALLFDHGADTDGATRVCLFIGPIFIELSWGAR
jgi:hypothetical protein